MASVNSVEKKYSGDENETEKFVKEEKVTYEYVTIPPDGGFGWIITAASLLCLLISDGILLSFGLILSELRYVFDEPAVKIAWIFSIENATSLISGKTKHLDLFILDFICNHSYQFYRTNSFGIE